MIRKVRDSPLYTELNHAGSERTGFKAEEFGCTRRSLNFPTSTLKSVNDVLSFQVFEALNRRASSSAVVPAIHLQERFLLCITERSMT